MIFTIYGLTESACGQLNSIRNSLLKSTLLTLILLISANKIFESCGLILALNNLRDLEQNPKLSRF